MSVEKAYAKALFEAAKDQNLGPDQIKVIEADLNQVADLIIHSKEARVALQSPATSSKEKVAVMKEIAKRVGTHSLVTHFLQLLAKKERLTIIDRIRIAFAEVRVQAEGGIIGQVQSADPLSEQDLTSLSSAFSRKLGKKVEFTTSTEAALLAGMKVTVNGVTYDGTLRSQLQRLRDQLVYGTGASH